MIGSCCSSWLPAAAATMTVASLPQHVDFALLSQWRISQSVLDTLVVVAAVAAIAPLIVALLPGPRVPQIVLLIIGGIAIGPQGFGLADPADLNLVATIGLGLVFLLAGYELDPAVFRERAGRLALIGWLITAALAAGLVGGLAAIGFVHAFVPVARGQPRRRWNAAADPA